MKEKIKELKNEKVYQAIRNMIALHRFKPGFNLNVQKLSKELGVSRTPVWEAMRKLEQEGVVQTIPNRGVFITEITSEGMIEVVEVRGALDVLAVQLACEKIDKRTIDQLEKCLPDQLHAIEANDMGAYFLSDNKFHGLIYKASGNSYLMNIYESVSLRMLSVPVSSEILLHSFNNSSVILAHQKIIKAFLDRDQTMAENAMNEHTQSILTYLKDKKKEETLRKMAVQKLEKKILRTHKEKRHTDHLSPKKAAMKQ